MTTQDTARLEIHVTRRKPVNMLREVREGLLRSPRQIPPRFFYDDKGSRLFERITELPEYYQTRAEETVLDRVADDIIERTKAEELIELGSGAARKTRVLLDAMKRQGCLRRYIPLDVSEGIVRRVSTEILEEYPGIHVHAMVADFTTHLEGIPPGHWQLTIFLGGTIGNFEPEEAVAFLRNLCGQLESGDHFLLGTDLIKDRKRLEAAYNDSEGITDQFNKNSLQVLNRLLGGNFDPEAFEHRAPYNEAKHRIEMWLRSSRRQTISLPEIDLEFTLEKDEEILTEISTKFDRGLVENLLNAAGFELVNLYTDPENLFALSLARKR